jgi:hypothetical protein
MKRYANGAEDSLIAYGAAIGLDIGPPPRQPRRRWFRH